MSYATPQRIDLKSPLEVYAVFSATFLRCIPTGNSSQFILLSSIASSYPLEIKLSKTGFFGKMPASLSFLINFCYVSTIASSELFFIGSDNTRFPSIANNIIMYLCPLDGAMGNFPVWSVYMVSLTWSIRT